MLILCLRNHLKELAPNEVLAIRSDAGPQVRIVLLVADVLRVGSGLRDVSTEDNCCKGLHFDAIAFYTKWVSKTCLSYNCGIVARLYFSSLTMSKDGYEIASILLGLA